MPDETNEASISKVDSAVIPAKLAAPDAAQTRDAVLEAIKCADGKLELNVEGDEPTACAIQILIAARRSAEARGVALTYSEHAAAAFDGIEMH